MPKITKTGSAIVEVVEEVRELFESSKTLKNVLEDSSDPGLLAAELTRMAAIQEVMSAYESRLAEIVPIPGVKPLDREDLEETVEPPSGPVPVDIYLNNQ